MTRSLQLAHFGLRTRDLPTAIEWYTRALGAYVRFQNDMAAFMSFDDVHHRFVLWDDGDTGEKPENARGVDHIGFSCGGPAELAGEYERLKGLGIAPVMSVNHHFTSSLYYRDPDGNVRWRSPATICRARPSAQPCLRLRWLRRCSLLSSARSSIPRSL